MMAGELTDTMTTDMTEKENTDVIMRVDMIPTEKMTVAEERTENMTGEINIHLANTKKNAPGNIKLFAFNLNICQCWTKHPHLQKQNI